ncbi:hypothetical protein TUN205_11052 [Pyrenophora tritici-repentis]|nr:hypothetical protein TUN205_11052 [Pyrenophora tritici-repentis]
MPIRLIVAESAKYEKICVGNKPADAQNVFFEGLLIKEGLGQDQTWHGKSCWGHPDFNRKSVSSVVVNMSWRCVNMG